LTNSGRAAEAEKSTLATGFWFLLGLGLFAIGMSMMGKTAGTSPGLIFIIGGIGCWIGELIRSRLSKRSKSRRVILLPRPHQDHDGPSETALEAARDRVQWPAIGLLITGIIQCAGTLFILIGTTTASLGLPADIPGTGLSIFHVMQATALVFGVIIIVGAAKMTQLKSHSLARLASDLALLPCGPAWLVGLPMGVWSLVVLNRPDVKAAFEANQRKRGRPALPVTPSVGTAAPETGKLVVKRRAPAPWLVSTSGWVVLISFLGVASGLLPWGQVSWYGTEPGKDPPGASSHWVTKPWYGHGIWQGKTVMALFLTLGLWRVALGRSVGPKRWHGFVLLAGGLSVLGLLYLAATPSSELGGLLQQGPHLWLVLPAALAIGLLVVAVIEFRGAWSAHERLASTAASAIDELMVQGPADGLILAGCAALLTAIGVGLWLWYRWHEAFLSELDKTNLLGMSVANATYALVIIMAGVLMRRLRARLFTLVCVVIGGLFVPAVAAWNVVQQQFMGLKNIPQWPVVIPMWLGVPVAIWATVVLFRRDVRAAFQRRFG
jgi:hypothetical protein